MTKIKKDKDINIPLKGIIDLMENKYDKPQPKKAVPKTAKKASPTKK